MKNVFFFIFVRDCFMTDDSEWRMVVRESGGSVFTTTTRPTTTLFGCYDDETTFPGEDGRPAIPSNRRPSTGHPDTIRPRARFPFAKGSDSAYRTCESLILFLLLSAVSIQAAFTVGLFFFLACLFLLFSCPAPVTSGPKVSIIQMKRRHNGGGVREGE